ncbi:MAG: DUF3189 family protein [Syntrophomonadaceae bacterium]|nr:DUF3189 family protein [Syntrophomonadaceae bacterium]
MNYLFVGKSGVFETVIAALVFMGKTKNIDEELKKNKVFGDIREDNKREPIFIKADNEGNKIYTLGTTNYALINDIVKEFYRVTEQKKINLLVTAINVRGETITYYLSRLATLPIIGSGFAFLAKAWVMYRKDDIIRHCHNMMSESRFSSEVKAAKPLK